MNTLKKYENRANALVDKLQRNCNEKTICENYGQNAVRKLIDKMAIEDDFKDLSYSEQCEIKDILYKVSSITPIRI